MAIANIIDKAKKMNAEQYGKKGPKKDKEVEGLPETTIAVTLDPTDEEDPGEMADAPKDKADVAEQEASKVESAAEEATETPEEEATETENEKALMEALMAEREKNKALEDQFAKWKEASEPLSEDTLNHQDAMMRELHGDEYGTALDHFHGLMQGDDGTELEALKAAPYPAIHAFKKGKEIMAQKQAESEAAKQAEREQMRQEIMAELEAKRAAEAPPVAKEVKKEEKPPKMMPAPAPTLPQGYAKSNEPEKKPSNIYSIVNAAKEKRKGA